MKRALSLLLAVVLAFGMASTALASQIIGTADGSHTDSVGWDEGKTATQTFDVVADGTLITSITNTNGNSFNVPNFAVYRTGTTTAAQGVVSNVSAAYKTGATDTLTVTVTPAANAPAGVYDLEFDIFGSDTTVAGAQKIEVDVTVTVTAVNGSMTGIQNVTNQSVAGTVGDTKDIVVAMTGSATATPDSAAGNAETFTIASAPTSGKFTIDLANIKITDDDEVTIPVTLIDDGDATDAFTINTGSGGTINVATVGTVVPQTTSGIPNDAKIVGINSDFDFAGRMDGLMVKDYNSYEEVRADDQVRIALIADMFLWEYTPSGGTKQSGTVTSTSWRNNQVTETMLSRGNIDVRTSTSKGSAAIRDASIQSGSNRVDAYIRIRFVEYFVSTSSLDYELSVYLSHKNSRNSNSKMTISGTIENEPESVYEEDDYISSEDGQVIKAEEYVRNIQMYGGVGVSAYRNLFSGQKYYFVVTTEVDSTDSKLMDSYPSIDMVYKVRQVNMAGSGTTVKFDVDGSYWVYNVDGEYIGRSNESLPFSTKYYLSTEQITISGTGTTEPDPDDGTGATPAPVDPGTGTGDTGNDNDNPGTGVSGLANLAIVAGLVALAGAGAVSLKK